MSMYYLTLMFGNDSSIQRSAYNIVFLCWLLLQINVLNLSYVWAYETWLQFCLKPLIIKHRCTSHLEYSVMNMKYCKWWSIFFFHIVTLLYFQVISMHLKLQTSCFKLSDSIKESHHECETYFTKITKYTSFSCNKSAKDCTASSWRSISCAQHKHGKILWLCLLPRNITFTQKLDFKTTVLW